ncbi:class I SAM-dependent methyltransferase [Flavobacterium sp.]|jgi:hypothetical protein|uniref:class I SAM-dependent methyltransferase n=1 Tax=Flavobacterium sp. TaxID=239 RepID=UPI0037C1464E
MDKKAHWEKVFETKAQNEVSWYQANPKTSVAFFVDNAIAKEAKIIEVGGGDSFLVDELLQLGYTNITVLDISENALLRLKERLGEKGKEVTFIVSDILNFATTEKFDVWHDRASFHFLTNPEEVALYVQKAKEFTSENALLFMGTFSDKGPLKCSGLEIQQYTEALFENVFIGFEKINCFTEDHLTPFDTIQNFIFCVFKK